METVIVCDILNRTRKSQDITLDLMQIKSLAEKAPQGKASYIDEEIFKIEKKMTRNTPDNIPTLFGQIKWVNKGLPEGEKLFNDALEYFQLCKKSGLELMGVAELEEFFKDYWLIYELKNLKEQVKDHSNLMEKLRNKKYIDNTDREIFNNAMKNGPLPPDNESKIVWIGKPADANKFCEHLGMVNDGHGRYKTWNQYFILEGKKPLYGNTKSFNAGGDIIDLLENEGYPEGYLKTIKPK